MNDGVKIWAGRLWRAAVTALWAAREIVRTLWSVVRAPLMALLNVVLAVIVLFEEWGWRPLVTLLGWLAHYAPIAWLERWIASLPPYSALGVFALPVALLFPLKFLALWLLAGGHVISATMLFIAAKIASTALIARIFMLTKPALLQIGWFARAYGRFVPWKEALFAEIRASWVWRYGRMLKTRLKLETKQAWTRLSPRLDAWLLTAPPWVREGAFAARSAVRSVREKLGKSTAQ